MKFIVTGASGFVGSHLVPAILAKGHEVRTLTRDETASSAPDLPASDVLVHLAAIADTGGNDPSAYAEVNHLLPVRLARRAAASAVKRFLFLSSTYAESHPNTPYGRAKANAEEDLLRIEGVEVSIVRAPLVYGPGAKSNMKALLSLSNTPFPLPFKSASAKRSLIYVENLVDAILFLSSSENVCNRIWTATDADAVSLAEIISAYRSGLGRPTRLFSAPWLPNLLCRLGKGELATKLFGEALCDGSVLYRAGWTPPVLAVDGLKKTAQKF
jgi:UDP-glucose 4-epimerase